MSWFEFSGIVAGAALLWSCGTSGPTSFRTEAIPLNTAEAAVYSSVARPDGAPRSPESSRIGAEIAAALAERGTRADSDGALGDAASWALREVNQGRIPDLRTLEAAARHYGFGGVVAGFSAGPTAGDSSWRRALEQVPANVPITRYGLRVSPSNASAAVVFGSSELDYEPVPRTFSPGQTVTAKGQVGSRFQFCHVYLTKPDGTVDERRMPDRSFSVAFPLDVKGQYRLEVMGDGATGPVVLSILPLFVGVDEPELQTRAGAAVAPAEGEARLFALLNEARRSAGLNPLAPDEQLRDVALAHSRDMADHNFFSHVSPTTGAPEDRRRTAKLLVSIFGENIGSNATPEAIYQALMDSPAHRANILHPRFTHVGIGAVKSGAGLTATMNFGRRPAPAEIPASAEAVQAAIAELRGRKSLAAVALDPVYGSGAQAAADSIVNGDDAELMRYQFGAALQREVNRLRTSRPPSCMLEVDLLELEQLDSVELLARPDLKRIGVGAHQQQDARGLRLVTVFVYEGTTCGP